MVERLFTVIDDEPTINPVLVNLKPFKELWMYDQSPDKNMFKKWMLYIWYMYNYKSPFFEAENKEEQVKIEVFGRSKYPTSKRVQRCIEEYTQRNTTAEQRTLDKAVNLCDDIVKNISKTSGDTRQFDDIVSEIEKEIEQSETVDLKVALMKEKMSLQEKSLDIAKKAADMIPRLQKQIEAIVELRKAVEMSLKDIENSRDAIENFIVDKFIRESELNDKA